MPSQNRPTTYPLLIVAIFVAFFAWRYPMQPNTSTYQTPFPDEGNDLWGIIPESYVLRLRPDHSADDIGAAIGQDIQPFVQVSLPASPYPGGWHGLSVIVRGVDKGLLEKIRTDWGVERVDFNFKAEMDDELESEPAR